MILIWLPSVNSSLMSKRVGGIHHNTHILGNHIASMTISNERCVSAVWVGGACFSIEYGHQCDNGDLIGVITGYNGANRSLPKWHFVP